MVTLETLHKARLAVGGSCGRSASMVAVSAMPVASGSTVTAPRSPSPASCSASAASRFVSFASREEPAA